jgi:uncharacterized phage protein (TIGR02218 family)
VKDIPSGLLSHYAATNLTLAYCILVTRTDGQSFRFTSLDRPLSVLGEVYEPGLDVTSIAQQAGLAVNNLEISVQYTSGFARADFLAGRWDGAAWELFQLNWALPGDGSNTIGHYVTGDLKPGRLACTIELRALSQYLQQPINMVTSKTCRARFADHPTPLPSALCRLDAATFSFTGAITSTSGNQQAADATMTQPDDYFADGLLSFDTGPNAGISRKVKVHDASSNGASYTFALPFPFAIEVGDTYTAIAGCRKRLEEDCRDKFDNVLNFQGEPHLPGPDLATARPDV